MYICVSVCVSVLVCVSYNVHTYTISFMLIICALTNLQVYCLGTILSMQISFVGFQPVQSSEHMAVSGAVTS